MATNEVHLLKSEDVTWCGTPLGASIRSSMTPKDAKCYECLRAAWEARESLADPKPIEERMLWFVCTGE